MMTCAVLVDDTEVTIKGNDGAILRQTLEGGRRLGRVESWREIDGLAEIRVASATFWVNAEHVLNWENRRGYIGGGDRQLACPTDDYRISG